MNNRYIFRGKRKDNGEWIEGYLVKYNERYYIYYEYADEMCQTGNYLSYKEVIPETVGQCTGLKDKNGKLIFEGDIVIDKYSRERFGFVGVVIYNTELTQFKIFNKYQPQYVVNLGSLRDSIRILGNIHDTPNLLKLEHDSLCETKNYKAGDEE